MKRRVIAVLLVCLLVTTVGAAIFLRFVEDDAAIWHVDPTTTERTGRPNDYVVAPAETILTLRDRDAEARDIPAKELLFLFDAVAMNSDRTQIVGGSVQDLWITYVQRSLIMGFPDYISVKAIETDKGAALVIWSRSRFGYSDMNVNQKRVEGWLAKIGDGS
jgi:uncharacterized protein (DUF1499 family)